MGTTRTRRYGGALTGLLAVLCLVRPASAHVLVTPSSSAPGAAQLYTITVQGERPVPTTQVRIQIPSGMVIASFAPSPGWQRQISLDSAGTVTAITWSGGLILPQEYAQFGIYARNPARTGTMTWPAYQTYQDGFPVAWTGSPASLQPAPTTQLGGLPPPGVTVAASGGGDGGVTADLALAAALLSLGLSGICLALVILAMRQRIL
ncbi:MAG TPA: DUF1775 domain-containing protein [Chloroflexota bacterium]|nr:DUF1775 domain-containing protein [Chloroflexota bacterium]